jgi:hypothetical protein
MTGKSFSRVYAPSNHLCSFQAFKNGKYSVTGVYITINNLPAHLRTLPENMMLVIAMPGPGEPTHYEFDQIMQPLIDELIALEGGKLPY